MNPEPPGKICVHSFDANITLKGPRIPSHLVLLHQEDGRDALDDGDVLEEASDAKVEEEVYRVEENEHGREDCDNVVEDEFVTLNPLGKHDEHHGQQTELLKERRPEREDDVDPVDALVLTTAGLLNTIQIMLLPAIALDGAAAHDHIISQRDAFVIHLRLLCLEPLLSYRRLGLQQ